MRRLPRPELLAVAGAALVFSIFTAAAPSGAPQPTAVRGQSAVTVGPIGFTVDDMDRSLAFYTGVLTFEKISDDLVNDPALAELTGVAGSRRIVRLRLGDEVLELTDYLTTGGRPVPADSRSQDHWFQHVAIIVRDMDQAYARLRGRDVAHVSPAPQRLPDWNPNAGGIRAFYFLDPDRHVLEILAFPAGKGDAKWHQAGAQLFLGIDHTAIVVSDTGRSLEFYRDRLGLRVAGTSENHGIEQERLNNVEGAHLRITTLRGAAGPGVEFLQYVSPTDGRPRPLGTRADDFLHWETTVRTTRLSELARWLRMAGTLFISPDSVRLAGTPAALVRDPDGHAVRIVERTS